jgi:pSer/pThr/pTyr-binding forkhead associated (FHA) protein
MIEHESARALFRSASGLSIPLALECREVNGSAAASVTHAFDFPFVLIGRDRRSDLSLDRPEISRRHAFLLSVAGRILVVDLESRTKISWDGEEAPRSKGWLDQDRFIHLGPYRIRRVDSHLSEDQQSELLNLSSSNRQTPVEAGSIPRAALESPIRIGEGRSLLPLDEPAVLVGRSADCELVLSDTTVSRFHAALVSTPSGVWVVDLLAREGVYVNGDRVRWAWLADGDSLRIASFTFNLRYETPPNQITRGDVPLQAGAFVAPQPGTELAVRVAPKSSRRSLAVRDGDRSSVRLQTTGFPKTLEPASLVPANSGAWDPSIPFNPNPMAMWQQQMQLMESFHNDMILMVQMFVAMHREHVASVRHELDMVQKLTGELSELQAKLADRSSATPGADRTARSGLPSQDRESDHARNRKNRDRKSVSRDHMHRSRAEPTPSSSEERASPPKPKPRSAEPSVLAGSRGSGEGQGSQIHAVLTERIAELQRERQGYWQKILSALHG